MAASTHLLERRTKPRARQASDTRLARPRVDGKFFARGQQRLRVCGVTYGPFAPNVDGEPFPARGLVAADFEQMRSLGINAIRTYHLPPEWLLALAEEHSLFVLIDVPWAKHLCFLEASEA